MERVLVRINIDSIIYEIIMDLHEVKTCEVSWRSGIAKTIVFRGCMHHVDANKMSYEFLTERILAIETREINQL